jgi:hypothetical protein
MEPDNVQRNALALKALGVIGLVAAIYLASGVAYNVLGSDEKITALRENSSMILVLLLLVSVCCATFRSLKKQ